MRDWNVNIGGGSGSSKQSIVFNVHYVGDSSASMRPVAIQKLITEFRAELNRVRLPAEDNRRVERGLTVIEEEAKASQPSVKDIESSLGSISRILQTATNVAPQVVSVFRGLAAALGFTL